MRHRNHINVLPTEKLQALPTKRLLALLKAVRAILSRIYFHAGPRCCSFCHEYVGNDWQKEVRDKAAPLESYKNEIKSILATREHIQRK